MARQVIALNKKEYYYITKADDVFFGLAELA